MPRTDRQIVAYCALGNRSTVALSLLEAIGCDVDELLARVIPARRPTGSRAEVFVTGHSSGGYMTVRLASHFADRISAFAPVGSGDPYGWYRDCTRRAGDRANVSGAGFDAETRRQICLLYTSDAADE